MTSKLPHDAEADVAHRFLARLMADLETGHVLGLVQYQALFPGHEAEIRQEHERLRGGTPSPGHDESAEWGQNGRFGPYRILRRIGRGRQAVVYAARDDRDGCTVALKILPPSEAIDRLSRLRLRREAKVLARLDHPHLGRVHDVGEHNGMPFIATELVEGESLAERIERLAPDSGRGPHAHIEDTIHLIERVADALHTVHEAGLLHRDIKPGNIMVTPEGSPVVVDFGLAHDDETLATSLTASGEVFGTLVYLPPEHVAAGSRGADRRGDVYSLGVTLYEALTSEIPFAGRSEAGLLQAILHAEPGDPRKAVPEIPKDLVLVLRTALAKEPDHRYQTARDLAEDLARVRRREPILARRPGWITRFLRWVKRARALSSVLAVLTLVLVGGVVSMIRWLAIESAALAQSERLGDVQMLSALERRRGSLWPELPHRVAEMDRWVAEAESLRERLPVHRSYLTAALLPGAELGRDFERLESFAEELENYEAKLDEVRRRRERAATLRERTVAAHAAAWAETCAAVRAHPGYAGLDLAPQVGLVPLGIDPGSGFCEFTHLPTGVAPSRDAQTEELVLTEECGLVFVLLPGGTFRMGAEPPSASRPPGTPNVDPHAAPTEGPAHAVTLVPFLISKYEMTQGQWSRLAGHNPSRWRPGIDAPDPIDLLHPIENVSWDKVRYELAKVGLAMPTEAQWEYAARGGTTTVWWTGDERDSLRGAANLADRSAARAGFNWPPILDWPEFDDGHVVHAPIGTYAPNPFGLHEVHGNVQEWCRDDHGRRAKVVRGGGFYDGVWTARIVNRYASREGTFSLGVRPVLEVR